MTIWIRAIRVGIVGCLVLGGLVASPEPATAATSPPKNTPLAFLSQANKNWVTAELGYAGSDYGMLRARSKIHGAWEAFTLVDTGDGAVAIRSSANGRYVSAELGYTGGDYAMLRARATAIGPWEKFIFVDLGGGSWALRSKANNLYVSAELGYGGADYAMLRARAGAIGPWEKFTFLYHQKRATTASRPVYFVHGYDGTPWHFTPGLNCWDYWGWAIQDFQNELPGPFSGPLITVGFYSDDTSCDARIAEGSRGTYIAELGRLLAWRIYNDYSRFGITVDAVGHSMGGLIIRAALTGTQRRLSDFPPFVFVEDVVTLATPHGGTAEAGYAICGAFTGAQCAQMQTGSAFLQSLDNNPQSDVGTDWTLVGADDDDIVPRWKALRMDNAGHLVAYPKPQPDGNGVEHTNIQTLTSGHFIFKYRDYWMTNLPYNSDTGWPVKDGDWDPIKVTRYGLYYPSDW